MTIGGKIRRAAGHRAGIMAVLLLALGACQPAAEKANAYEALYDQLMPVKAYPAALTTIQSAIARDESEPRRWLKLGQVLLLLDRPAEAAEAFQHALDLQPDNLGALENLAILSVRGNQFDMAKRYADPLLLIQPNSLGGLLASSMVALHERRYADAAKAADQVIAIYPDREDGRVIKARILDASGRTRAAADLLAGRAAQIPDSAEVNRPLLTLYQKLGDRQGIQDTAIRLAKIYPDDPRYALESARAWHARGRNDLADATIAAGIVRFRGNPGAMNAVAGYWRETLPTATAHDRIVGLASKGNPAVKGALASTLVAMGDPAAATTLLAPLAAAPVSAANVDLQARYARALLAAGRTADAEAKTRTILAFDPGNPDGLLLRAHLELARKDYSTALTDAQLAASDDDQNEEAALLVATIYAAQGNQTLAGAGFASARNTFPDSVTALRAETQWLIAQNRPADALARTASFTESHPRRGDGWALYAELCRAVGKGSCSGNAHPDPGSNS